MTVDLTDIFAKYEALVAEVDSVFARVAEMHPGCISCEVGCSDCCHALFDLSLVEAMYLNTRFQERFALGKERSDIMERASEIDRQGYKIKRQAYKKSREGAEPREILEDMAKARLRCPLLGKDESCELYEFRPITCRLYGVPTAIGGKAHTCGKAKFEKGHQYPTVNIERIQDRLIALSQELADAVGTRFKDLPGVFVPVSMALITEYDAKYLGTDTPKKESA